MSSFRWIIALALVLGVVLLGMAGCGSGDGVPQATYDAVKSQLADCQNRVAELQSQTGEPGATVMPDVALQSQLQALQADYDALSSDYELLKEQAASGDTSGQLKALQEAYDELNQEYESLHEQCAALAESTQETTLAADDIEQTIFARINEERQSAGESPLSPGPNLLKLARSNSTDMSDEGEYQYSTYPGVWQKIFIAAGYTTADQVAGSAMSVWKKNNYRFEYDVLNPNAKYGAVGVAKAGDIYYITFLAATFR